MFFFNLVLGIWSVFLFLTFVPGTHTTFFLRPCGILWYTLPVPLTAALKDFEVTKIVLVAFTVIQNAAFGHIFPHLYHVSIFIFTATCYGSVVAEIYDGVVGSTLYFR